MLRAQQEMIAAQQKQIEAQHEQLVAQQRYVLSLDHNVMRSITSIASGRRGLAGRLKSSVKESGADLIVSRVPCLRWVSVYV